MRKIKIFGGLLLMLLVLSPSFLVSAAPSVPAEVTGYLGGEGAGAFGVVIKVSGLSSSQKIKKSSIKSSDTSVVSGYPQISYSGKTATIQLSAIKAGTAIISFKIDGIEYTTKATVRNYKNPSKSVTVTNVKYGSKSNLATGWRKGAYYAGPDLSKTTSNAVIKIKAKSGWKVRNIRLYPMFGSTKYFTRNYSKPKSNVSLKLNKNLTKTENNGYFLEITYVNTQNKGTITQTMMFK